MAKMSDDQRLRRNAYMREYNKRKPPKKRNSDEHRAAARERMRALRDADPEAWRAKVRDYLQRNPDKRKARNLLFNYGLTLDRFFEILAEQNGACAICKQVPLDVFGRKGFQVDHCHKSLKVRGLLCANCNLMLGHARDKIANLKAAIAYLEREEDEGQ